MFDKMVMSSMYEKANRPEDLVWHSDEPTKLLDDAVSAVLATTDGRRPPRALDLGCGAGIHSAYLAQKGFEVTGIDLIPKAIELARSHAQSKGVEIDFVAADLLEWSADRPFDLVLDSGCLHSLIHGNVARYKERLVSSLIAPSSGEYVLCHWAKRHLFDWRPMGPRRRAANHLATLFAPELVEIARHEELMTDIPLPFGPSVLAVAMRFRSSR
jgi:SAM-dependent methyltransferase